MRVVKSTQGASSLDPRDSNGGVQRPQGEDRGIEEESMAHSENFTSRHGTTVATKPDTGTVLLLAGA